jgi:hypothetical protein
VLASPTPTVGIFEDSTTEIRASNPDRRALSWKMKAAIHPAVPPPTITKWGVSGMRLPAGNDLSFTGSVGHPSLIRGDEPDGNRAPFDADGMIPIILNGHGGNRAPLQVAVAELGAAGIRAAGFSYFDLIAEEARTTLPDAATGTGHACALETSLMMALFAGAVRASRIPSGGTPPSWPDPHLYAASPVAVWRGFEEINPTGVIGKPSEASATAGEALFAAAVQRSVEAVHRLRQSWGQFSSRHV